MSTYLIYGVVKMINKARKLLIVNSEDGKEFGIPFHKQNGVKLQIGDHVCCSVYDTKDFKRNETKIMVDNLISSSKDMSTLGRQYIVSEHENGKRRVGGGAKSGEIQQHSHYSHHSHHSHQKGTFQKHTSGSRRQHPQQHHQKVHSQQHQYHKRGSPKSEAKVGFQQPQESSPYSQQGSKPFVLPCKKTQTSHGSVKDASLHSHIDEKSELQGKISGGGAKIADTKGFISVEEHTRILQELKDCQAQIKDLISYNNLLESQVQSLQAYSTMIRTNGKGF